MGKKDLHDKKNIEFRFQADPGKDVFIAGSFNDWNPTKTKLKDKGDGLYTVKLQLRSGAHEYKFVVDDIWQVDPQNPETMDNACGSINSVVTL